MKQTFFFLILSVQWLLAQQPQAVFWYEDQRWADSVLKTMTLEQKIGQLYMVAAYSNRDEKHMRELKKLVEKHHIGGLIFFQGTALKQAEMTNTLQSIAKIPLMIAMDAEWGLAMRLKTIENLPWAMTIGATYDTMLAFEVGREIARQCRRLGVHINFGPVVDINTNPKNPIINARSFGEDPDLVSQMAKAYTNGQQRLRVLACAKHFPGHGDTKEDSHLTLPTVEHPLQRLQQVELKPFKVLFDAGVGSVMIAHLNVPSIDSSGTPTSLSEKVSTDLLVKELKFDGIIFTDALNMKGASTFKTEEHIDVLALAAGADVVLMSEDVLGGITAVKKALEDGKLTHEQLNYKVRKILQAKYWMGLHQLKPIETDQLEKELTTNETENIRFRIAEKSLTLLVNQNRTLPILPPYPNSVMAVSLGKTDSLLLNLLKIYVPTTHIDFDSTRMLEILNNLWQHDYLFLIVSPVSHSPWVRFRYSESFKKLINLASLQTKVVLIHLGNPYDLMNVDEVRYTAATVVSYQNYRETSLALINTLFGHSSFQGQLPVSILPDFPAGYGIKTPSFPVLGFATPNLAGFNQQILLNIDKIAQDGIAQGAYPGCQILVARDGKVVYHKAFGKQTYAAESAAVQLHHIYDLASITKIAASVPAIMHLVENGMLDLDMRLGHYYPSARGTNKEHLIIRDILTHRAGLQAWIPFYQSTLTKTGYKPGIYSKTHSLEYPFQVADSLYIHKNYRDTIRKRILESPLGEFGKYVYSDLGYYLLKEVIENQLNQPLDQWLYANVYSKIGANSLVFNPLKKFPKSEIAPTENDQTFRNQLVHGYVHDQGAAMLGGISGHAGLFGNAFDLAKLMQLYVNNGRYAQSQIFDSLVIAEFIRCQYCAEGNRRGIGFDKPQLSGQGPTCGCLSFESFGHSGFTGTLAWADPSEKIVYIFLSNRIYPDASNEKLLKNAYRTRIQQVIYDALIK
ncbi:beta-N-acetylglucosaminidase [Thermaurantimonas aggregans]|uniref:beta-N-acetylhexosaminidase n=1 Tax=Thermaurantimonas aggregans TaxID=2173829 RepID=A0A401XNT4_9FLAO|nr:glycoside hydrolase family 3 N-terminal domain-containing protein [Thermaurantimonas aggregans]MCX8148859.1 serine hydrolase [Thermaurantimonas aggregans]GCD78676.1 beta-N-acetylglucosaminidase [Thermaurantimonas aggregans]